jgi:ribosomal protein S18 acetylase RimI-like enzyme
MKYEQDDAHLLLFSVDEPDRRRGLGTQLLQWLETVARAAGITSIRLEVRKSNAGAIAFYKKHGYLQQEEVLGMYFGSEDGIRFLKHL